MQLNKHTRGQVTVITFDGSLDSSNSADIKEELEKLVPDIGTSVLDLSQMEYMSSAGLRVLLLTHRRAETTGARIVLACLHADVREVMSATGFLDFFDVVDTVEAEALA